MPNLPDLISEGRRLLATNPTDFAGVGVYAIKNLPLLLDEIERLQKGLKEAESLTNNWMKECKELYKAIESWKKEEILWKEQEAAYLKQLSSLKAAARKVYDQQQSVHVVDEHRAAWKQLKDALGDENGKLE